MGWLEKNPIHFEHFQNVYAEFQHKFIENLTILRSVSYKVVQLLLYILWYKKQGTQIISNVF